MFWDNLCKLCESRNISPTRLALEIGLSNAASVRWKKGTIPQGNTLQKIADYFGVSTSHLLGEDIPSTVDDPLPTADNIFPITRTAFPLLGEIA